ncbi:MAG: hypothetical protein NC293_06290 [Roseburia sp.]|nr:hypothetical protein [Roseburia sp.]
MIRKGIKNTIIGSLNFDIFRIDDFAITIEDENGYSIKIDYDKYYFYIQFNESDFEDVKILYSPGQIYNQAENKLYAFAFDTDIKIQIHKWLYRVKRELTSPVIRDISETVVNFADDFAERINNMNDEFFNIKEADELKKRLEKLEEIILKRDADRNDYELMEEIEKMKVEIKFLKDTIDKLSKKNWLKSALSKLGAWSKRPENQEVIRLGIEVVNAVSKNRLPGDK